MTVLYRMTEPPLMANGKPNRAVTAILEEIEWFIDCSLLIVATPDDQCTLKHSDGSWHTYAMFDLGPADE